MLEHDDDGSGDDEGFEPDRDCSTFHRSSSYRRPSEPGRWFRRRSWAPALSLLQRKDRLRECESIVYQFNVNPEAGLEALVESALLGDSFPVRQQRA